MVKYCVIVKRRTTANEFHNKTGTVNVKRSVYYPIQTHGEYQIVGKDACRITYVQYAHCPHTSARHAAAME